VINHFLNGYAPSPTANLPAEITLPSSALLYISKLLKMPNNDREDEISSSCEGLCGISNMVGALDGTHIAIVNCPGGKNDYINRK
jgi:hypothetical protein